MHQFVYKVKTGKTELSDMLLESLELIGYERRNCDILMRFLCKQDKLEDAFALLNIMKEKGVPRGRETYRPLMLGCCKYEDNDFALLVLELMIHDGVTDWISFKRVFDSLGASVDRRIWNAYDVIKYFLPVNRYGLASMRLTGYITEFMDDLNLGASKRAGRGFITLPNPISIRRPLFEWSKLFLPDPVYDIDEEGRLVELLDEEEERLRMICDDFEDINNLEEIIQKVRDKREGIEAPPVDVNSLIRVVEREKEREIPKKRVIGVNENLDLSLLQGTERERYEMLRIEARKKESDGFDK